MDIVERKDTTSVGNMRKKADERGLDKEEEDYFNPDRLVKLYFPHFLLILCCLVELIAYIGYFFLNVALFT